MKTMTTALALLFATVSARSSLVTRDIDYEHNGVKLQGFLAYDDSKTAGGKVPGVLVIHEWWGLNDYVKRRAVQLAELGYVAFAADMYGKGVLAKDPKEAGELAGHQGKLLGKPSGRRPAWTSCSAAAWSIPHGWRRSATASVARPSRRSPTRARRWRAS